MRYFPYFQDTQDSYASYLGVHDNHPDGYVFASEAIRTAERNTPSFVIDANDVLVYRSAYHTP